MDLNSSVYFIDPRKVNRDAPLFVYLPGMDGTGKLLQTQADCLAASFDLRCLAIRVDSYSTWQVLARDTVKLIRAELAKKTNPEIYLCGESFGGCLALKTALAAPELLDRLILVNPASSFNQLPLLSWGVELSSWMPSWIHGYSAAGLLPFLVRLNRISDCDRDRLIKSMKSVPPQVVAWRLSLLKKFQVNNEQLRSLKMPCLIIAGAADDLLPSVKEAQKLANIMPKARMTVLPRSGHACLLETEIDLYQILMEQNFIPPKYAFC